MVSGPVSVWRMGSAALLVELDSLAEVTALQSFLLERAGQLGNAHVDGAPVERAQVEGARVKGATVDSAPVDSAPVERATVERATVAGLVDVVAAARTVLVTANSPLALPGIRAAIARFSLPVQGSPAAKWNSRPDATGPDATGPDTTMDTVYRGEDLASAAALSGMSPEALVAWHSGQTWTAAFSGFAPGFMYLLGESGRLIPRRVTPRISVPPGSVALGGEFSAVYPAKSPGGWQLIGQVADELWDPARTPAALLRPGSRVRFRPVRELLRLAAAAVDIEAASTAVAGTEAASTEVAEPELKADLSLKAGSSPSAWYGLRVLHAGIQTTVQDLGRPGFAHLGLTSSGALDRGALRRANRLVGNNPGTALQLAGVQTATPQTAFLQAAAVLETVLGGLVVQASGSHIVAISGACAQLVLTDPAGTERTVPLDAPFLLPDGHTLTLTVQAEHAAGFRSYLAVRGGLSVPLVLNSRSTDTLSGTGPLPLAAGSFLPVAPARYGVVGFAETSPLPPPQGDVTELHFVPGPRSNWFTDDSLTSFTQLPWTVTPASNRVGLRLEYLSAHKDAVLQRTPASPAELASEGMVKGAIQVPPSGVPLLFLADHPVTGGYPVIGVVVGADLDKAAQLAPGARVRFVQAC